MNAMQLERIGEAVLLRMRAGKANAMGPAWLERMEALLDEALTARARALVITGYEGFFSAGLDLPTLDGLDDRAMGSFMSGFSRTMLRIFELPMPVVAAVNGHAIAGGCVLALQADVRIGAASDFRIGLNEVQLGIGLPAVVLEALRAQVPAASLLPIALEGRLFSPEEAVSVGLLHEVVPADRLEQRAVARAMELGALPGAAYASVKHGLRAPVAQRVRELAGQDAARWAETWSGEEARERRRRAIERLSRKK
ncbi:MAG: enoyl-CoA hydratase/isomerase family protein [Deltaproteobacteria bacterium]|nr:MAG: enoyl-CoA hydratase/isomerase family protein [Deltaproteobacteria bacterium]